MEGWLKDSGAVGLDALELADFPVTGRGLTTLRRFKEGDRILTIPSDILWTVEHAYDDSLLGPALRSARPPLSVDDTLAIYILFVRSRESGYTGLRSHLAAVPQCYSSSIFFTEDELEVCAGTSLYTITKRLRQCIEDDYRALVVQVLGQHRDLFPPDKFTIEDVGIIPCDGYCESTTNASFRLFSTSGLFAPCGVARWILYCPMVNRFDLWRPLRIC